VVGAHVLKQVRVASTQWGLSEGEPALTSSSATSSLTLLSL
jgi:hypothetical protein